MLNDTYAVTDLNVLNVDTYHKIWASSVGRASVLLNSRSQVQTSMVLFCFFFSGRSYALVVYSSTRYGPSN